MIDEGFIEDQAGSGLIQPGRPAPDPKPAALLRVGPAWPTGPLGVPGMEYRTGAGGGRGQGRDRQRAASDRPVAGLGRVVAAAPDAATALGYDITAALEEPDGH